MNVRTLRELDITGARVLLRTDYDIEVYEEQVLDDLRLLASLPTIQQLRAAGARIAICSHRGTPEGSRRPELSNHPLAARLSDLLGADVGTAADCVGSEVEDAVRNLEPGGVLLLENLRFHPGEESNDPDFAAALARLADVFVNDAFAALQLEHASIVGVPALLPSAAGMLVEREVEALEAVTTRPERPAALVLGGMKVREKLQLVEHLLPQLDVLCLGGLFGISVLHAAGLRIPGISLDAETTDRARRLIEAIRERPEFRLVLPASVVATNGVRALSMSPVQVPDGWEIMDIGGLTARAFQEALLGCRTVIWNGPLGMFQRAPFDTGTYEMAAYIAELPARTLAAGGETAVAVRRGGFYNDFTHVSTGGAGTLRLLAGLPLPGLEALHAA